MYKLVQQCLKGGFHLMLVVQCNAYQSLHRGSALVPKEYEFLSRRNAPTHFSMEQALLSPKNE